MVEPKQIRKFIFASCLFIFFTQASAASFEPFELSVPILNFSPQKILHPPYILKSNDPEVDITLLYLSYVFQKLGFLTYRPFGKTLERVHKKAEWYKKKLLNYTPFTEHTIATITQYVGYITDQVAQEMFEGKQKNIWLLFENNIGDRTHHSDRPSLSERFTIKANNFKLACEDQKIFSNLITGTGPRQHAFIKLLLTDLQKMAECHRARNPFSFTVRFVPVDPTNNNCKHCHNQLQPEETEASWIEGENWKQLEMALRYRLITCRSCDTGSTTVSELEFIKKPEFLVILLRTQSTIEVADLRYEDTNFKLVRQAKNYGKEDLVFMYEYQKQKNHKPTTSIDISGNPESSSESCCIIL